MRIDEAWHHELVRCVDGLLDLARTKLGNRLAPRDRVGDSGAHRSDLTVDNQDVGDRRLVDIAVMVIDAAALDQHDAVGCGGSGRRHSETP